MNKNSQPNCIRPNTIVLLHLSVWNLASVGVSQLRSRVQILLSAYQDGMINAPMECLTLNRQQSLMVGRETSIGTLEQSKDLTTLIV